MKTMVPENSIDLLVAHMRQRQVDVLRRAQERRMALYAQASPEEQSAARAQAMYDYQALHDYDADPESSGRGVHTFSLV